jgi:hypothetical protein
MRQPRENEMLCRFGCKTIVSKDLASCEMCCDEAVSLRIARLAPIEAEELIKCEEYTEKLRAARNKAKPQEEAPSEEPLPEAPKKRGRPAKEVA